jgi:hypothetical protein
MIQIDNDLHLPDSLRKELRKPLGKVRESYELLQDLKGQDKHIITIGDSVSSFFIRQGLPPNLIIWDGNTKRHPVDESTFKLLTAHAKKQDVQNPPATLTKGAWQAVTDSLTKNRASVFVRGEEDLLAIPAILNSEDGTCIIYGHPPGKGAILIVVNSKIKSVFQDILSKFESK